MPSRRNTLLAGGIWGLAAFCLLPAIFHWRAPAAGLPPDSLLPALLSFAVAGAFGAGIFVLERRRLDRSRLALLVVLVLSLTAIVDYLHRVNVDDATNEFTYPHVIESSPAVLPHSYRPLPDSIVRWIELAGMPFEPARDLYRLIFSLALFYGLYRYARISCSFAGAVIAMLIVFGIYSVSFVDYTGQFTDPLSHLSFVAALALVESDDFVLFLTTLCIGALAQETVLVMAAFFLMFRRNASSYRMKALLVSGGVAAYVACRWLVLGGTNGSAQISGVTPGHIAENVASWVWPQGFVFMLGGLSVLLAIGWKNAPAALKRQALFLFVALLVSSAFFGWLWEGRNFMPLVIVVAVAAGRYAELCFSGGPAWTSATAVGSAGGMRIAQVGAAASAGPRSLAAAFRSWFLTFAIVPLLIAALWISGIYGRRLTGQMPHDYSLSGSEPELGYIDSAVLADGNQTLSVKGWSADRAAGAPVSRVTISIDGVPAGDAQLSLARNDVARFYRKPDYANSGWEFRGPVSRVRPGTHSVTAIATGVSGSTLLAGSRTITIEPK